jgi:hypothetical protein
MYANTKSRVNLKVKKITVVCFLDDVTVRVFKCLNEQWIQQMGRSQKEETGSEPLETNNPNEAYN